MGREGKRKRDADRGREGGKRRGGGGKKELGDNYSLHCDHSTVSLHLVYCNRKQLATIATTICSELVKHTPVQKILLGLNKQATERERTALRAVLSSTVVAEDPGATLHV